MDTKDALVWIANAALFSSSRQSLVLFLPISHCPPAFHRGSTSQAFLYSISLGGFGLGWLRDFFLMANMVEQVGLSHDYVNDMVRMGLGSSRCLDLSS